MADGVAVGDLIRRWRTRTPPRPAGPDPRAGRRPAGLRREELAALSGVSIDYLIRIEQGARAIRRCRSNVSSTVGWPRDLADPSTPEHGVTALAYAASKSAEIVLTVQYAKNLPDFRVNVANPGYTATDMTGHRGTQTVEEGSDAIVALATLGPDGPTGEFRDRRSRIDY